MTKTKVNYLVASGFFLLMLGGAISFTGYMAKNNSNVIKGIRMVSLSQN